MRQLVAFPSAEGSSNWASHWKHFEFWSHGGQRHCLWSIRQRVTASPVTASLDKTLGLDPTLWAEIFSSSFASHLLALREQLTQESPPRHVLVGGPPHCCSVLRQHVQHNKQKGLCWAQTQSLTPRFPLYGNARRPYIVTAHVTNYFLNCFTASQSK